jgi:hypothetical protein
MVDTEAYSVPLTLEPELVRVHEYWQGLKRGANDIPFWDDLKISLQTRLAQETVLIEVFENPQRFRFDMVGEDVTKRYGKAFNGKFADEIDPHEPLNEFESQCRTTVERRAPTYYRNGPTNKGADDNVYSRLILPLWGNGRVEMLLGAVVS